MIIDCVVLNNFFKLFFTVNPLTDITNHKSGNTYRIVQLNLIPLYEKKNPSAVWKFKKNVT